jgi:threonine/homoserine/homoserine lactone efflux protein
MSEKNNVGGKSSKSLANILALIGGAYLSYAIYGLIKGAEEKKRIGLIFF